MLDIEKLSKYQIPTSRLEVTRRDTMLYALGVGLGADPEDEGQLQFLLRDRLKALPTMATILAMPYAWIRSADVNFGGKSVHAGIEVRLAGELPVEGCFESDNRIVEILDKGAGKAAVVSIARTITEKGSGRTVAEIRSTNMFRGDGGFGGPSQPETAPHTLPERAPDATYDMPTLNQQGLLYQLNGDYNPLHNDPEAARRLGFPRPILHGLSTFGIAGHALLKHLCDYQPGHMTAIGANFTKPVYPGETLEVRVWQEEGGASFQVVVPARGGDVVLDRGFVELAATA